MGVGQYPIEFMFTPGRITTHHEAWMQWRIIYTDGRPHPAPEDYDPTFGGHSIGKWEGETLVVDTTPSRTRFPWGRGCATATSSTSWSACACQKTIRTP